MAYRYHVWLVTLALAGVVGTACRTQRPAGTGTGEPRTARNTAASKTEIESPKDADKRVEVHVHYAMGVLHELNEETNEAIEEFTKSIEGDPGNEALVIELSRKLVQLKRYTKAEELLTRATARPQASANLFARLGLVYYFLGKKEQAITANNTALKKNPRLLSAYQNLFQLYLQSNQHDDALKVLERASVQPEPQAGYLIDLAELYTRYARSGGEREQIGKQRALELLDRAAELDLREGVLSQRLAETYARMGELSKGIKIYLKMLEQSSDPISVRERLIALYLSANDKEGVARQSEAIAREYPSAEAFSSLGRIAEAQRNYKAAAEYFNKALEFNPDYDEVYYQLAGVQINADQPRDGLATLERARAKFSRNFRTEFYSGMAYLQMKEFTNAASRFADALELNPEFESVYYELAAAQINSDEPRQGLATLDKARAKFSRNFLTEFYSGMAYTQMKDFTNAVGRFVEAEKIAQISDTNRLNHVFYFQLGAACERNQQFAEAEKYFKKALALKPDFAEALNYLGYMWADRGEHLPEARELIEKAVKLDSNHAEYIDSLGWVLFRLNQAEEALRHILRAVELSRKPDATLYDHLGDIYTKLNQPDRAREAWQKSLSLEPNEAVKKKLEPTLPAKTSPR